MLNNKNTTLVEVMEFHGNQIAFEEINGKMMVNATQMAKPFGKRAVDWLNTQQAKDLFTTVSEVRKITSTDLQIVKKGGHNQGTWFQKDIALFFAQWLSPEFYLACNMKLEELLTKQSLLLPAKNGVTPIIHEQQFLYSYNDSLISMNASIKSSASKRKSRHPQHFFKIYGRNFITAQYFDLMKGYYDYKNATNQLALSL